MGKKTLTNLLCWYLDLPDVKQLKSLADRKVSLQRSVRFLSARKDAETVKGLDLLSYQKHLMAFDFAPATINKEICYITNMFRKAIGYGYLDMPAPFVIPLRVNNIREKMLSLDSYELLVDNCPEEIKLLVKVAYWTPMRRSEFLGLTWDNINLDGGYITMDWSKTKKSYSRLVPLHPDIVLDLKQILWKRGLVFNKDGKRISDSMLARYFKKACEDSGIEDFVFHDLRHCAANNMRLAGNELGVIMKAGGWRSIQALQRYLLVDPKEIESVKWIKGVR